MADKLYKNEHSSLFCEFFNENRNVLNNALKIKQMINFFTFWKLKVLCLAAMFECEGIFKRFPRTKQSSLFWQIVIHDC
jgi:hypothetical protein